MNGLLKQSSCFYQMVNDHYYARYQRFIDSLKNQVVGGYSEVHHIVPISMGGSNDKSNLIALTARQHYVAHWILARALGGSAARAFFMMSNFGKYGAVNSTTYEKARKEYAKQVSLQLKGKPSQCDFSDATRQKMREAKIGRKLSPEHIEKVRQAQIGRVYDNDFRRKISEAKKGQPNGRLGTTMSDETKRKIIESNINRPMVTCPHCQQTMKDHGGAKRWHFDRCKYKQEAA